MAIPLKASTASQEIPLGYFVDSTDGNTEETGLTIANTDIKLWKAGATTLANKNSGGATHISNGIYYAVLDDTDTDTVGPLLIFVHVSGALAVRVECVVYPAVVYDSLIGGTDALQVDMIQIVGQTVTCAAGVTVLASVGTAATSTAQTGDSYARIGAPVGASVSADIAAIKSQTDAIETDTQDLQTQIGIDGAGLTAIGDARLANLDAAVSTRLAAAGYTAPLDATATQSAAAAALTAYDPPTKAELDSAVSPLATATSIAALNNLSAAQVNAEVDAALSDIHLDHLLAADYDPASKPGVATALLNELIESDSGVSRFTANALEQAPSGGGSLTVADIVDGVLDELLSEHTDVGSVGAGIAAAGSAGDPWATVLPGAYGAGTAGKIVGDNLITPVVSSQGIRDAMSLPRSASASVLSAPSGSLDAMIESAMRQHGDIWYERNTDANAISKVFDDNAIDAASGLATTFDAEGGSAAGIYAMAEFDGSLFVAIGNNLPAGGTAAVVARFDPGSMTPIFEYMLPEEGCSSIIVSHDGATLVVPGADERVDNGVSAIYVRDQSGWVTRETLTDMGLHVMGGVFTAGGRLYVCGRGTNCLAWSDDVGLTWTYGGPSGTIRAHAVYRFSNDALLVQGWDQGVSPNTYNLYYSADGLTWSTIYSSTYRNQGNIVFWRNVAVVAWREDTILTVDSAGTVTAYRLPFLLGPAAARYQRSVVDSDGYLCVLGATGVWRTPDLRTWQRVWELTPDSGTLAAAQDTAAIATWGTDLVVSTIGLNAALLIRPMGSRALQLMQRNAMMLAPTAGAPATGSLDKHLDDVVADTAAIKLITDMLDVSAVTQVAASSAGHLTITAGLTYSDGVTGLTIPADWETAIWTLKYNAAQADTAAVIQLRVTNPADAEADGLQLLNGAAVESPITAADGTLTVTQASGRIDIYLSDESTLLLSKATGLGWDVKFIDANGDSTGRRGTADVVLTETQAVT